MIYLLLFFEFFKIGLFTVGGGMASIPFLYDLAERYDWFTAADVTYFIAISESSPGPIAVNMATFAGNHTAGLLGGAAATLGSIAPGLIIVILVTKVLSKYKDNRYLLAGLGGIRPAVIAMITIAFLTVARISLLHTGDFHSPMHWLRLIDYRAVALFGVMLFAMLKFKKHPIIYIVLGGVVGVFLAP